MIPSFFYHGRKMPRLVGDCRCNKEMPPGHKDAIETFINIALCLDVWGERYFSPERMENDLANPSYVPSLVTFEVLDYLRRIEMPYQHGLCEAMFYHGMPKVETEEDKLKKLDYDGGRTVRMVLRRGQRGWRDNGYSDKYDKYLVEYKKLFDDIIEQVKLIETLDIPW